MGNEPSSRPQIGRKNELKHSAIWKERIIPYEMDQSLAECHDIILKVIRHIEENSKYNFRSRISEYKYLRLDKENGCSIVEGDNQIPRVSLGMNSNTFGAVLHEIVYALGFELEHNRSDRDNYLEVYLYTVKEDIRPKFATFTYDIWSCYDFDYDSIMLYGSRTGAINKDVACMKAKDGGLLLDPSEKRGLSHMDKTKLRIASTILEMEDVYA